MKSLLSAAVLLATCSSVQAIEIPRDWLDNHDLCMSDDESPAHAKACRAARRIEKQLYQEGMRANRNGQCYRARPYTRSDGSNSPATWVWEQGYNAQGEKHPRDWSHCQPANRGTP